MRYCSFNFISRTCNRVAHVLAKYVLSIDLSLTMFGDFPYWAQRKAMLDVPSIEF